MSDPNLIDLMSGELHKEKHLKKKSPNKDKFELFIEEEINNQINNLEFNPEDLSCKLLPPSLRRSQLKEDMQKALKTEPLSSHIEKAFKILSEEGRLNLSDDEYEEMIKELIQLGEKLENVDLNALKNEQSLQPLNSLSSETMSAIGKLAVAKFAQGEISDSLSLYMLLTTLNTNQSEYWFRLGITAHQMKDDDLAIKAYQMAADLDDTWLSPRLLHLEILEQQKKWDLAEKLIDEAQAIVKQEGIDSDWKPLFEALSTNYINKI